MWSCQLVKSYVYMSPMIRYVHAYSCTFHPSFHIVTSYDLTRLSYSLVHMLCFRFVYLALLCLMVLHLAL